MLTREHGVKYYHKSNFAMCGIAVTPEVFMVSPKLSDVFLAFFLKQIYQYLLPVEFKYRNRSKSQKKVRYLGFVWLL